MSLIYPLLLGLFGPRLAALLVRAARPARARAATSWSASSWSGPSWSASAGHAMAAVLAAASVTHLREPQRSGLVAIVPAAVPFPEHVVTLTGAAELVLAAGLLHPRTRRPAAVATAALLLALYPANVVAARGVDHPAAPDTPLAPRTALQAVLVGVSLLAARRDAVAAQTVPARRPGPAGAAG